MVNPQRDIDRFEELLNNTDAELRYVLETHLHNDYISGGRDLAKKAGGELVLPSGAAPVFRHRPAFHNENLNGGRLTVRPIHTPGHTPEHMSYLILIEDEPAAVFSGGSLLVGSAGRSDLLGDAGSLATYRQEGFYLQALSDGDYEGAFAVLDPEFYEGCDAGSLATYRQEGFTARIEDRERQTDTDKAFVAVTMTFGDGGAFGSQWTNYQSFSVVRHDGSWWITGEDVWPYFAWDCLNGAEG